MLGEATMRAWRRDWLLRALLVLVPGLVTCLPELSMSWWLCTGGGCALAVLVLLCERGKESL